MVMSYKRSRVAQGLEAILDKAVHIEDGKTMSRYIL